jgi:protein gp37
MAEDTKIGWTDHTFSPWTGCQKVGPGCDHCYAEAWAKRSGVVQWGPDAERRRTGAPVWAMPLKLQGRHPAFYAEHGRRQRIFSASLSDVFDNAAPIEWFVDLLRLIYATPDLDWLLLTKRIGTFHARMGQALLALDDAYQPPGFQEWIEAWLKGVPPDNVWIGATVVNQEEADRDIPKLLAVPARVRFLSIEPMLGPIVKDFVPLVGSLHWIISGFESGPGCRPGDLAWLRQLVTSAHIATIPMFVKQLGGNPNKRDDLYDLPEDLRIRQWPADSARSTK